MTLFRLATAALLFTFSSFCLAQGSLAMTTDNKLVGWLLGKGPNTAGQMTIQYLTPDGYILSLKDVTIPDSQGTIPSPSNTQGTVVEELFFESNDCTEQAWINGTHRLHGEIVQLGSDNKSPVFFRMNYHEFSVSRSFLSKRVASGSCTAPISETEAGFPVTEVDPVDYGFHTDAGYWFIADRVHQVQRPDAMFCNGFENCPTE